MPGGGSASAHALAFRHVAGVGFSAEKRAFVPERRVRDRTWSEKGGLSMGLRKRLEDAAKLVQRQDGTGGTYEFESRDGG